MTLSGLCATFLLTGMTVPADLSAADRAAIFRLLCEGKLVRDRKGWVCKDPEPNEESSLSMRLAALRWGTAMPGRFVAGDGEWLVGLDGLCMQGCVGESYVVTKTGGRWTLLAESPHRVHDGCIVLRARASGLDALVCEQGAGPNMGEMFTALDLVSFARGEVAHHRLMQAEQGGECHLPGAPPGTRSRADELEKLAAGDPGSEVAFTVLLVRQTASCDDASREPARTEGRHLLKFLERGGAIVPDPETARVLREHDWAPAPEGR